MKQDRDHYEAYYANKLWNLLPAVYRSLDTDQFNSFGPLREMVNRIGKQAAILRRSIDRMWQDQSIETCDDWVIPYIGDLLATNLVANLDAAGQRMDVAHTIYYRRRKGTLAVLEEIAADITGWDAKVVEFFRRMARTRHGLDPAIGLSLQPGDATDQLQQAQGLIGSFTRTPIGGTARLCNVYGASKTQSAFDEFFHTADFRYGQGQVGWHNIPRLGVFLWRLMSFQTGPVTPVAVQGCPGWFTFDPTGRDIPLFAKGGRTSDYYASQWVSPVEAQLATPISQALWDAETCSSPPSEGSPPLQSPPANCPPAQNASLLLLYPGSLAVYSTATPQSAQDTVALSDLLVRPARGRVHTPQSPQGRVWLSYCYGFAATTGAGPYDRRLVRAQPTQPAPPSSIKGGGAFNFPSSGTFTLADSLTYNNPNKVTLSGDLTIMAANETRPLLRFAPAQNWVNWIITSPSNANPNLTLDGLFVSGADIVLRGNFNAVTITCCTLDPGSSAASASAAIMDESPPSPLESAVFALSADGRDLLPCRLWIEGTIATLTIQSSVLGPIRTRAGGEVESLSMTDSIIQGIRTAGWGPFEIGDIKDAAGLQQALYAAEDPVSNYLGTLPPLHQWLQSIPHSSPAVSQPSWTQATLQGLLNALNQLLSGPSLYHDNPGAFSQVPLSATTTQLMGEASPPSFASAALNRSLLEDAYPLELADAALALGDGDVSLSRCTLLGRLNVHRLQASECILNDLAVVDDAQHGCVRFSCLSANSALPRQFESVQAQPGAPLFTSTDFGQPGYGQLEPTADSQIINADATNNTSAPQTILSGAENGSEMGAFCLAQNSIKERALLIKYQEYMPAGLIPVLVYVT